MLAIRVAAEPGAPGAVVLPVLIVDGEPGLPPIAYDLPDEARAEAAELLGDLDGEAGATRLLRRPLREPGQLLLSHAGSGDEAGWRAAGAAASRAFADEMSITVAMPLDVSVDAVRGLAEGLWLAAYRFSLSDEPAPERAVTVVVEQPERYADALAAARAVADATRLARDLTNTPSSLKNPAWFAEQVSAAAEGHAGLTLSVREPEQLAAEGFGGILAVGAGSASPPRLLELSWRPAGARTHVVLVGKGITFDTGGISIKPVDAMKLMRKDMGGAASVVAATVGAAALDLPVRVTALAPLAENLLSGSAFRPGDVVRHYGGLTSETTNSDAEGRLVLADALAYAVERLAPDLLVDFATLTGANAVALGKRTAALYSENDDLAAVFIGAAEEAGERAWRMPLPSDYVEYLGSEVADLFSAPDRGAGSVVAALYLREFVGDRRDRWVHLDMSAPSWSESADGVLPKGATGWGVRALLRWLAALPPSDALDGGQ
ncbi:leucyl aminopeptidase family protein [Phytohabitans kaempferiae]|uniref:Probable cytosol aminopeptidase n=1 Tax=Phytohabitans kaempferiae TaxID=1620943 RepID=A0ABV6M127_9ACTN